ncbi:ComEA family DNA-binding protein [Culturomica massiliensis]|uniref:ComEA family DNA-binding protein n=1 Tax=Culturomica massiliensis TaxID=1841857 RepID=UPI003AEF9C09
MNRIQYPAEKIKFHEEYISRFGDSEGKFDDCKKAVSSILSSGNSVFRSFDNISWNDIMVGSLDKLIELWDEFRVLDEQVKVKLNKEFGACFDYDVHQADIANFFMRYASELHLCSCHYCNMDYINVFSNIEKYTGKLDFINHASENELKELFNIGKGKARKIIEARQKKEFTSLEDLKRISPAGYNSLNDDSIRKWNHFTIDHYICRAKCKLFSLSLYNFVPCCVVCNSKLKHDDLVNEKGNILLKLSPSSEKFEFDKKVKFRLIISPDANIMRFDQCMEKFHIDIDTSEDADFDDFVRMFHLKSRYNFHKIEAVYLAYLKQKYPDSQIREFRNILQGSVGGKYSFTEEMIKNDLFGRTVFQNSNRSFSKLKRDIYEELDSE